MGRVNTIEVIINGKDNASRVVGGVAKNLQTIGKAAVAGLGVLGTAAAGAGAALTKLALDAAPLEGIERAFEDIATRSGQAADEMLAALESTSAGMVAQRDLMKSYNQAAALVGDQFANRLPDAMSVLTKAAAATGEDMDYMLDSLVRGVGRTSPLILDNLGVQMDMNKALEDYATKHGIGAISTTIDHSAAIADATQKLSGMERELASAEEKLSRENDELALAKTYWAEGSAELKKFQERVQGAQLAVDKKRASLEDQRGSLVKLQAEHGKTVTSTEDLTKSMSKADQQMALFEQVIGKLEEKYADMPPVTENVATSIAALQAKFQNFKDQVGKAVLPVVGKVLGKFSELGDKVMPLLTDFVEMTLVPALNKLVWAFEVLFDAVSGGTLDISTIDDILQEFLPIEVIDRIWGFIGSVQNLIETVRPYIVMATQWIAENVKLQDVLIALGIAVATVIIPLIASLVASVAPVVATFVGLVAVIALLRKAWETDFLGIRTSLTEFWENTAKPALQELWAWLQVNIPVAIQTLSEYWRTTLLPALRAAWDFIQTSVLPVLADLWAWLSKNVPAAIQTLANYWDNKLMPALRTAWTFFNDHILPVLVAVADVADAVLGKALEALAGLWQNVLYPALQRVWSILEPHILPLLEKLGGETAPIVAAVFERIGGILDSLAEKLHGFADTIRNLELPEWLQPGSATPFEEALLGIAVAVLEQMMPAFSSFMAMLTEGWNLFAALLLEELWPLMQEQWISLTNLMLERWSAMTASMIALFEGLVAAMVAGIATMISNWDELRGALKKVEDALQKVEDGIKKITGSEMLGRLSRLIKKFEKLAEAAREAAKAMKDAGGGGGGAPAPLQRGMFSVPRTMPAILHPGEMVVPAWAAKAMRQNVYNFNQVVNTRATTDVTVQSFETMVALTS